MELKPYFVIKWNDLIVELVDFIVDKF